MVRLMNSRKVSPESDSLRRKTVSVKLEVEDEDGPLTKRSKNDLGTGAFPVPPSQYNPLAEPSPLGLRLKKSPSLLDLIQMKISQGNASKVGIPAKKENKTNIASGSTDKLKASNFPASFLGIGTWEYKSRYEGDLVGKCYFAKHKLVWEVLDGGLKNKIEIQWSDIMALKANYPDDVAGTLDVVLSRPPLFFRETNPQPRKHTLWQATSDFTGGQASIYRRHFLQCLPGLLGKHFEKLVQCDPRLNFLSQQAEIVLESPHFDLKISVFDDSDELNDGFELNNDEPELFDLRNSATPSGTQSSSSKNEQEDLVCRPPKHIHRETPSPSSVMDKHTIEGIRSSKAGESISLSNQDPIKLPGLHPSMSMTDLLSQIEQRLADRTSNSSTLSSEELQSLEILEEISRCLFSDSQHISTSDEKSIVSRVNSLCCLVQKDRDQMVENRVDARTVAEEDSLTPAMSRKDSVGELLLNLPRIASLPQFFFNISEDFDNQAR